jgi:hypothetical protein
LPANAALAEQPWGSIRRDGFPARLHEHWEADCMRPCAIIPPSAGSNCHVDILRRVAALEWPVEAERRHPCPFLARWLFWNLMAHHLCLMMKTQHRHRTGFKPKHASSLRIKVKAPKIFGKAARA